MSKTSGSIRGMINAALGISNGPVMFASSSLLFLLLLVHSGVRRWSLLPPSKHIACSDDDCEAITQPSSLDTLFPGTFDGAPKRVKRIITSLPSFLVEVSSPNNYHSKGKSKAPVASASPCPLHLFLRIRLANDLASSTTSSKSSACARDSNDISLLPLDDGLHEEGLQDIAAAGVAGVVELEIVSHLPFHLLVCKVGPEGRLNYVHLLPPASSSGTATVASAAVVVTVSSRAGRVLEGGVVCFCARCCAPYSLPTTLGDIGHEDILFLSVPRRMERALPRLTERFTVTLQSECEDEETTATVSDTHTGLTSQESRAEVSDFNTVWGNSDREVFILVNSATKRLAGSLEDVEEGKEMLSTANFRCTRAEQETFDSRVTECNIDEQFVPPPYTLTVSTPPTSLSTRACLSHLSSSSSCRNLKDGVPTPETTRKEEEGAEHDSLRRRQEDLVCGETSSPVSPLLRLHDLPERQQPLQQTFSLTSSAAPLPRDHMKRNQLQLSPNNLFPCDYQENNFSNGLSNAFDCEMLLEHGEELEAVFSLAERLHEGSGNSIYHGEGGCEKVLQWSEEDDEDEKELLLTDLDNGTLNILCEEDTVIISHAQICNRSLHNSSESESVERQLRVAASCRKESERLVATSEEIDDNHNTNSAKKKKKSTAVRRETVEPPDGVFDNFLWAVVRALTTTSTTPLPPDLSSPTSANSSSLCSRSSSYCSLEELQDTTNEADVVISTSMNAHI